MTPLVENPSCCAVVVVDMQNDYCHPDGAMARMGNDVTAAARVLPNVLSLLELARDHGVPCILVRTTHGPWTDTHGWRSRGQGGDMLDLEQTPLVAVGSWGAEFFEVEPRPEDLVVTKHRYSAFAFTPLELALHARDRDMVLCAGTMTNACVEATAIDAVMRGFRAALISDCTATSSDEAQRLGLAKFAALIGPVIDLATLRAAWQ